MRKIYAAIAMASVINFNVEAVNYLFVKIENYVSQISVNYTDNFNKPEDMVNFCIKVIDSTCQPEMKVSDALRAQLQGIKQKLDNNKAQFEVAVVENMRTNNKLYEYIHNQFEIIRKAGFCFTSVFSKEEVDNMEEDFKAFLRRHYSCSVDKDFFSVNISNEIYDNYVKAQESCKGPVKLEEYKTLAYL